MSASSAAPDPPHRRAAKLDAELRVGVAIVGAGACGLTAALMLHDAGVECVLLERDAVPSGSTALSSGFIPAPGTRVQLAEGVADDSPGRFDSDIRAKTHGRAAPAAHRGRDRSMRHTPQPTPAAPAHAPWSGCRQRSVRGCRRSRHGHAARACPARE